MFKQALVTGATSGIGAAVAELLSKKGISLILTGRDQQRLAEQANKLHAKTFAANLDKPEGVLLTIANIHHYKPDLVINCAGFGYYGEAYKMPQQDIDEMINVNVRAVIQLTNTAAETMINNSIKGVILNVSSAAAYFESPYYALYVSTKAFVNKYSTSLDFELSGKGVRVLTACPGLVDTSFSERAAKGQLKRNDRKALIMSSESVANQIWHQIEKGQRIKLMDWRYRVLYELSKFLPASLQAKVIGDSIKARIGQ